MAAKLEHLVERFTLGEKMDDAEQLEAAVPVGELPGPSTVGAAG